jgi:hypothetical protein
VYTDSLHHGFARLSASRTNLTFEYLVIALYPQPPTFNPQPSTE